MSSPRSLAGKLGRLPLWRQVAALAIWPFLEQILGFMVSTIDLLLATRMVEGDTRIAMVDALGLGGYVMWLMMIVQGSTATGVMAIVSRAAGARQIDEARSGLTQGLLIGLTLGIVSGIIIRSFLPHLIAAFALSPEAAAFAHEYLAILCWTCPILGLLFSCTYSLRAIGDTRTPFFVMLVINLINASLSWLLVFGPEPFGGLGISGLAYGSLFAWALGTTVILALLFRANRPQEDEVTLTLRDNTRDDWKPHPTMMARIGKVGLPHGFEMTGMWLIHAYVLNLITRLPIEGALGAHIIAIRIESLSFLPGFAIGTASATLVGQYLGAKNPAMAMKALRTAWIFALVFMSSIGVFFLIAPETIVRLILPETDAQASALIAIASPLIFLCGIFQPALATNIIMKTSLRGAGATRSIMKASFASLIFYRIIVMTACAGTIGLNLTTIWIIMSLDLFTQALYFALLAKRGTWLETQV